MTRSLLAWSCPRVWTLPGEEAASHSLVEKSECSPPLWSDQRSHRNSTKSHLHRARPRAGRSRWPTALQCVFVAARSGQNVGLLLAECDNPTDQASAAFRQKSLFPRRSVSGRWSITWLNDTLVMPNPSEAASRISALPDRKVLQH